MYHQKIIFEKTLPSQAQCLTPVIPASQEAEMGELQFQTSPGKKN
jgi:hypothetical protein